MDGLLTENVDGIIIYTFTNSSESAVDAWGAALTQVIEETPPDQLFRVLMDVSSPQVSFSRPARSMSQQVFTRYRSRKGRMAFLFSSKTAPHYARIFFASLGRLQFQLQFFSNRDKALHWLHE
ncbi:MAG: hypothetical protein K8I30_23280 [Anaerolineae bacterium]|nr:hypothetical protein [Anaerolineae bacterium]